MSAADEERRRLSKSYRELPATELLSLYEKREALSPVATDCLRTELRLRGLDPDSLRATVPKATPTEDDGPAGHASLVDEHSDEPSRAARPPAPEGESDLDADAEAEAEPEPPAPPPEEAASPAEAAASAAAIRCIHCGTRNPAIEDLCLRCGQPLGESPAGQTMSRRVAESGGSSSRNPTGTIGSATTGVIGISALVFASYSLTLERRVIVVSLAAAAVGLVALAAAIVLHRIEKRRRAGPAAN